MRKLFCLTLALCLALCSTAFAFDYSYDYFYSNEATFETLEEARINGPVFLGEQIPGRIYLPDPAMDDYPVGTTYVYRSAETLNGNTAACRKNTNILVYTDAQLEDKDAVYAYLQNLGLIDIIAEAHGSIVLVNPIDAKAGFGVADVAAYSKLQAAMCNVYSSIRTAGNPEYYADYTYFYADSAYYGGITYRYLIGIDGGATFVNNYIAPVMDDVSRLAGMLLVNGDMSHVYNVADPVPVYLINPCDLAVERYMTINEVDSINRTAAYECFYNAQQPLQRVAIATSDELTAEVVDAVYHDFFIKAMRIPAARENQYSNGQFIGYKFNQAPYCLFSRNAIIDGVTVRGNIHVIEKTDTERFQAIQTPDGFYMDVWYEVLPEAVLNNTAPEHSVPMLLAVHGGSDHPIQFMEEIGYLDLIADEQFAMIAPCHQNFYADADVLGRTLAATVEYALEQYPAIDPSRVYVSGYSKGGGASVTVGVMRSDLFAAVIPMAAGGGFLGDEAQQAKLQEIGMPFMMLTSRYDAPGAFTPDGTIGANYQASLNRYLGYNGMDPIEFDFETYPISGFAGDIFTQRLVNNEHVNMFWQLLNDDGEPRVALCFTEDLIHALYPEYGRIAWNFAKHFSRNQETGLIEYDANR